MEILGRGRPITDLASWKTNGGPKGGDDQWKDGYSAKELAKAWFPDDKGPVMPSEIQALFGSSELSREVKFVKGLVECRVSIDDRAGERRNTDLVLLGEGDPPLLVASIEAKAGESFGSSVTSTLTAAKERRKTNDRSRGEDRVRELVCVVLGIEGEIDEPTGRLPYQLFTAAVGAVRAASNASLAALIIHEFVGFPGNVRGESAFKASHAGLTRFVQRLVGEATLTIEEGRFYGPISLAGAVGAGWPGLLIGKVSSRPRSST